MPRRVLPYVELRERTAPLTEEQEAEAMLLALVGHNCKFCGRGLSPAAGYQCCFPHCPLCGKLAWQCAHCVAEKRRRVILWGSDGHQLPIVETPVFKQTPERYRLAEQKGQLVLAFDAIPPATGDMVAEKKAWKRKLGTLSRYLLETVLLPDIRTAHANTSGRYSYHYFSREPEAARARVLHAARRMHEVGDDHIIHQRRKRCPAPNVSCSSA